jgi:hypothetical protein
MCLPEKSYLTPTDTQTDFDPKSIRHRPKVFSRSTQLSFRDPQVYLSICVEHLSIPVDIAATIVEFTIRRILDTICSCDDIHFILLGKGSKSLQRFY